MIASDFFSGGFFSIPKFTRREVGVFAFPIQRWYSANSQWIDQRQKDV